MAGGAIQMRQFAAVAFAKVLLVVSLFGNHHSPVHGTGGIMFSGCPSVCTCVRKFARAFPGGGNLQSACCRLLVF